MKAGQIGRPKTETGYKEKLCRTIWFRGSSPTTSTRPHMDEATVHDINALNDELEAAGARIFAGGLSAPSQAKSLRPQPNGEVLITDGPYLEAKEHVGGFTIIEAADMDEALAWGRKCCHRLPDAGRVARDPIQQPAERHTSPIAPAKAVSTPPAKPAPPPTSTTVSATTPVGRAKCPRRFVEFQCCRSLTK